MQLCPAFMKAALHGHLGGQVQVRIIEHDKGIGAAELQHGLLQMRPGHCRDLAPGHIAAGQAHGAHGGMGDDLRHRVGADQQRREHPGRRLCIAKQRLDRQRAAGDIGRVLQQHRVAGRERRRRAAEQLPKREVPRHHRQHRPERLTGDQAAPGIGGDEFVGKIGVGVLRIVLADQRALVDLRLGLADQLAHLSAHQACQLGTALAQQRGNAGQQPRAPRQRRSAPVQSRTSRGVQALGHRPGVHGLETGHRRAVGRIDALDGHAWISRVI
jgi:hypothetical protein